MAIKLQIINEEVFNEKVESVNLSDLTYTGLGFRGSVTIFKNGGGSVVVPILDSFSCKDYGFELTTNK